MPQPFSETPPVSGTAAPCRACSSAAQQAQAQIEAYKRGTRTRTLLVACACRGNEPALLDSLSPDEPMPAASLAKLPLALAAIRAHGEGLLDLNQRIVVQQIGTTSHRDLLSVYPEGHREKLGVLLGLGLAVSSNPAFDYLARHDHVRATANTLHPGAHIEAGFSDDDLEGPVRANSITARATASILVSIWQEAIGDAAPLFAGLANGARTTRLVRDTELLASLDTSTVIANKTGTLAGVRNDSALFARRDEALVVVVLTKQQQNVHELDSELASLGRSLFEARFPEART